MAQKNPPPSNAQIEDVIAAVATAIYDAFPVFDQDGMRQTDFAGRISGGVVGQSIGWVFRIEGVTAQGIIDWIKAQFGPYASKTAPTPGGASWMAAWTDLLGDAHDFSAKLETQFKGTVPAPHGHVASAPVEPAASLGLATDSVEIVRRLSLDPPVGWNGFQFANAHDWAAIWKAKREATLSRLQGDDSWGVVPEDTVKLLALSGFADDPPMRSSDGKAVTGAFTPGELAGMSPIAFARYADPAVYQTGGGQAQVG